MQRAHVHTAYRSAHSLPLSRTKSGAKLTSRRTPLVTRYSQLYCTRNTATTEPCTASFHGLDPACLSLAHFDSFIEATATRHPAHSAPPSLSTCAFMYAIVARNFLNSLFRTKSSEVIGRRETASGDVVPVTCHAWRPSLRRAPMRDDEMVVGPLGAEDGRKL